MESMSLETVSVESVPVMTICGQCVNKLHTHECVKDASKGTSLI